MAHCREAQLTELYDELLLVRHLVVMTQKSCCVSVPQSPKDSITFFVRPRFSPCCRTLAPVWPPLVLLLTRLALVRFSKPSFWLPLFAPRTRSAKSRSNDPNLLLLPSNQSARSLTRLQPRRWRRGSMHTMSICPSSKTLSYRREMPPAAHSTSPGLCVCQKEGRPTHLHTSVRGCNASFLPSIIGILPLQACRRAERRMVELAQVDDVDESAKQFINRYGPCAVELSTTWLPSSHPFRRSSAPGLNRPSD